MPDDPENASVLVPRHLSPWAGILNRGWPTEAGPIPSAAEAQQALELGAKAGTKVGLAWAMYCRRPEGATQKEVTAACGGPQLNKSRKAARERRVAFESRKRADGILAYFLAPSDSNPAEPGAKQLIEEIVLDPAVVARWIAKLRVFFPDLDKFDKPDPHFDEAERTYKLEIAAELKAAITQPGSDQDLADAVNTALAKSNLLQWRAYWPMSPKGDADREKLWPALRELVDAALGAADGHALALDTFVNAWIAAVPNGKPDPARQIGEFLFLHLAPDDGIYIRHSVRQDLWLEAVGSRFPDHASMADTYRDEWRFMMAVRSAFEAQGLAPRDMIDVQSALWVVHNYKEGDIASFSREAIEAAMDAYDIYRQSGEHAAIFDAFGEPRDE